MGLEIKYGTGQTPINEDERGNLIPFWINTNEELNLVEQQNINKAIKFFSHKNLDCHKILSVYFLKSLHKKMFGEVWEWAGDFRTTDKNIGVTKTQIRSFLYQLLDDIIYWIDHKVFSPDTIAIRCKHRLVAIHPFVNGNGRHSRLFADLLIKSLGGDVFSWGATLQEARKKYLSSLREADQYSYDALLQFARS
ncbi:MAG: mobile mystery protein B [Bacteroidota bacterium]